MFTGPITNCRPLCNNYIKINLQFTDYEPNTLRSNNEIILYIHLVWQDSPNSISGTALHIYIYFGPLCTRVYIDSLGWKAPIRKLHKKYRRNIWNAQFETWYRVKFRAKWGSRKTDKIYFSLCAMKSWKGDTYRTEKKEFLFFHKSETDHRVEMN